MADRVVVMDQGRIIANDDPWNIGDYLAGETAEERHPMFYGMPSVMKIYSACGGSKMKHGLKETADGRHLAPLTIRDGRLWLEAVLGDPDDFRAKSTASAAADTPADSETPGTDVLRDPIITIKDLWHQYDRHSGEVLRGLNLEVKEGELFCLMGGNGAGKSTTLKAVAGIIKPQRGTIHVDGLKVCKENTAKLMGKVMAMVPQNPQALFTEITAEEELAEALYDRKLPAEEVVRRVDAMLDTMEITHLRKSHPYDLSGGEQQRLALGKHAVELRLDPQAAKLIPGTPAGELDFDTEFLDYILAVGIVDSVEAATAHIAAHSTGHSEAILTADDAAARYFTRTVDSAAVYVNCSTRFTDGGEFGLGCEMGISTQKLHARGPMGLEELCCYKYVIRGSGQIR